jgi:EmrB/QacA subfamily drug resistance transporter
VPNFLHGPCNHVSTNLPIKAVPANCEKWVLLATILGSSMAFIDGTIVNVALPAIQESLHASISQMQWVVEAYALTLAALLLVGGALGDLYGQRIIFLIGILVFTVASVACGIAPTIMILIITRAIQGIGAALLVPGSLALITISFPDERRGQAIGTWAGFTAITSAAGPVLGGWLVQQVSWRWIFFLNLPIAVIVFIVTLLWVSESEKQKQKLDIKGAFLATIGFGAIVFGLIEWGNGGVRVIATEILGILALIAFFVVEKYTPYPMVPLGLFKSRNFSGTNLITFFLYFALYGVLFFLPLYMIQVQAYSATAAGAAFLPVILLIFLLSRTAGGLVKQLGARWPLIIGPAIVALGFGLFLNANVANSYWSSIFPGTVVLGLGMAVSIAPLTTTVMNSVASAHAGTASGINNAVSRIAGLMAIAILGLVMTKVFNYHLVEKLKISSIPAPARQEVLRQSTQFANIKTHDESTHRLVQESFIAGYKIVIWIAVALSFFSSLSAAVLIKDEKK